MTHYRARLQTRPADSRLTGIGLAAGLVAGAAAITAVSAQASLTVPGSPIPFTLQPVAVLLAGAVLGARRGALSQITYLAAGIAGAAAFAWSPVLLPGVARLMGPTGGFLMAFPAAAFVAGFAQKRGSSGVLGAGVAMLAGLAVLYAGGALWASRFLPDAAAVAATLAPYAASDLVKVALAAPAVPALRRAVSGWQA